MNDDAVRPAGGTAQPTADEMAACRHHLVDFLSPDEAYSAQRFRRDLLREAAAAAQHVHQQRVNSGFADLRQQTCVARQVVVGEFVLAAHVAQDAGHLLVGRQALNGWFPEFGQ
mgnify:CR=1 FL=1